jgi:CheY-like chemotaxis protein/HPt (histidine-containing phosphotransfer) domain-containing protein
MQGSAVEAFAQQTFDLVLMDMQMPEMDGATATKLIRQKQQETGIQVPIIAMTAHAMAGDREKCIAAGMDDYISKPVNRTGLAAVIARNTSQVASVGHSAAEVSEPAAQVSPDNHVPSPAADHGDWVIDREEMLRGLGGNETLLQTLVEMFPEETGKLYTAMQEARRGQSAGELEIRAHTLKGICKMFGATLAVGIAHELENAALTGSLGTDAQMEILGQELG